MGLLNYIFNTLTNPNETFKIAIKKDLLQTAILIVFIYIVLSSIGDFIMRDFVQLASTIGAGTLGYILSSLLSSWFAIKFFKGKGNFRKTLIVFGFATAPLLIMGILYIPLALNIGNAATISLFLLGLTQIVTGIWTLILDVKGLMIAHKIGVWKSIVSILIPGILIVAVIALLIFAVLSLI